MVVAFKWTGMKQLLADSEPADQGTSHIVAEREPMVRPKPGPPCPVSLPHSFSTCRLGFSDFSDLISCRPSTGTFPSNAHADFAIGGGDVPLLRHKRSPQSQLFLPYWMALCPRRWSFQQPTHSEDIHRPLELTHRCQYRVLRW